MRAWARRAAGPTLEVSRSLLDDPGDGARGVLRRRPEAISREVEGMREHRRAILRLLATFNLKQKGKRA